MLIIVLTFLRSLFCPRHDLVLENLALRQQILVLERQIKRAEFRDRDRAFWVVLRLFWTKWKIPLRLVQPQTVVSWHRYLWRKYWKRKSRPKEMGRPKIPSEVIKLIRRISLENPNWGATHIQGELMMLGHFLTIPTITFKTLYVFIVLSLDRRRVVHFHVTRHPTADWTELQLIQAFPFDTAPKYLIRDRDGIYGEKVLRTIDQIGIEDRPTSPHSPWKNGYCERMVGTLKRECLNHMVIFNERHARRIIREFLEYYHEDRTHQGLDQETPRGRKIEPPEIGPVKSRPVLGGLHHRYFREAA